MVDDDILSKVEDWLMMIFDQKEDVDDGRVDHNSEYILSREHENQEDNNDDHDDHDHVDDSEGDDGGDYEDNSDDNDDGNDDENNNDNDDDDDGDDEQVEGEEEERLVASQEVSDVVARHNRQTF